MARFAACSVEGVCSNAGAYASMASAPTANSFQSGFLGPIVCKGCSMQMDARIKTDCMISEAPKSQDVDLTQENTPKRKQHLHDTGTSLEIQKPALREYFGALQNFFQTCRLKQQLQNRMLLGWGRGPKRSPWAEDPA